MLYDVVSPSSYLTFNVTIAQVIGLVNAVYCAELLDIYSKARRKNKLDENEFFVLNRDYVKTKTTIRVEEQYLCDAALSSVGLIETSKESVDKIKFNVTLFMQFIAEKDSKELSKIYKKIVNIQNQAEAKRLKNESYKESLYKVLLDNNVLIKQALEAWINTLLKQKVYLVKETVEKFQEDVYNYAKSDVEKAVQIINYAKIYGWSICADAIAALEREQGLKIKSTPLKVATSNNLSNKRY